MIFFSHHLHVVHMAQLYYFEDIPTQKPQALMYSLVFRLPLIDWSKGLSTPDNCNGDDNDNNNNNNNNNNSNKVALRFGVK